MKPEKYLKLKVVGSEGRFSQKYSCRTFNRPEIQTETVKYFGKIVDLLFWIDTIEYQEQDLAVERWSDLIVINRWTDIGFVG